MSSDSRSIRLLYVDPDRSAAEEVASRLEAEDDHLTVISVLLAADAQDRLRNTSVD